MWTHLFAKKCDFFLKKHIFDVTLDLFPLAKKSIKPLEQIQS